MDKARPDHPACTSFIKIERPGVVGVRAAAARIRKLQIFRRPLSLTARITRSPKVPEQNAHLCARHHVHRLQRHVLSGESSGVFPVLRKKSPFPTRSAHLLARNKLLIPIQNCNDGQRDSGSRVSRDSLIKRRHAGGDGQQQYSADDELAKNLLAVFIRFPPAACLSFSYCSMPACKNPHKTKRHA